MENYVLTIKSCKNNSPFNKESDNVHKKYTQVKKN